MNNLVSISTISYSNDVLSIVNIMQDVNPNTLKRVHMREPTPVALDHAW